VGELKGRNVFGTRSSHEKERWKGEVLMRESAAKTIRKGIEKKTGKERGTNDGTTGKQGGQRQIGNRRKAQERC